jgi:4-amino-4-deoxy-L-arabinose transferase-like glycosyltransferase
VDDEEESMAARKVRPYLVAMIAMLIASTCVVAWTSSVVHVPTGYAVGSAALSVVVMFLPRWPSGFVGVVLTVIVSAAVIVLKNAFYGNAPLASAALLQSVAVFTSAIAAAALLRVAILIVRRRRLGATPT